MSVCEIRIQRQLMWKSRKECVIGQNHKIFTSTFDFSTNCAQEVECATRKPCHPMAIVELNFRRENIMHTIEELCRQFTESFENFLERGEYA